MPNPSEFAEHVEVGDTIEWRTETLDNEAIIYTVVEVQESQYKFEILVEGSQGGRYRLSIHEDGRADAYYLTPSGEEEHLGPLTEVNIYSPAFEYSRSS